MDHLDKNGQCALVHAALRGHLEVVKFLIQCDWTMAGQQQGVFKKSHAIQQALIAAASMGYTEVRKQVVRFWGLGLQFNHDLINGVVPQFTNNSFPNNFIVIKSGM